MNGRSDFFETFRYFENWEHFFIFFVTNHNDSGSQSPLFLSFITDDSLASLPAERLDGM